MSPDVTQVDEAVRVALRRGSSSIRPVPITVVKCTTVFDSPVEVVTCGSGLDPLEADADTSLVSTVWSVHGSLLRVLVRRAFGDLIRMLSSMALILLMTVGASVEVSIKSSTDGGAMGTAVKFPGSRGATPLSSGDGRSGQDIQSAVDWTCT